ncbi:MAG: alcohol dehydrogenase catalytic domain-containing protein [Calditrichaceae bacterium]|nr:alcohol dehydrogenase catalytic domain-containing protein [Calditrichaceae bacterium]
MKTVKLISKQAFGEFDEMMPVPDNINKVLIKIASIGVCGSDMHYFKHGRIGDQVVEYPYTIGHEASGYIEKIYGDSFGLEVGQLVAIEPAVSCGQCDQCRAGRHHTCRHIQFMGAPGQIEGLMCEHVTVPIQNVFPVPESFSPNEAAFVEPMSIGAYAVKLGQISENDNIGIIGVGPIGMSVLLSLKYWGNNRQYVWDKLDYRLENAKKTGVLWSGNPDKIKIQKELQKIIPEELDVVFECCGEQEALDTALEVLKPGGRLVIVGIPAEDRISFDMGCLRRKEISIINVRRQNHSVEDAIKIVEHFRPLDDFLITHTFNYDQTNEAFKLVNDYADNVVKAVIKF